MHVRKRIYKSNQMQQSVRQSETKDECELVTVILKQRFVDKIFDSNDIRVCYIYLHLESYLHERSTVAPVKIKIELSDQNQSFHQYSLFALVQGNGIAMCCRWKMKV